MFFFLVGDLIKQDHSAIETLRNHAKTIGGVVGAEYQFFEDRRPTEEKLKEDNFFYEKNFQKLYDLRFKDIEKTPLGKQITQQILRLEERERNLKTSILDLKAEHRQREAAIYAQADSVMIHQYKEKQQKQLEAFKDEVNFIKATSRA